MLLICKHLCACHAPIGRRHGLYPGEVFSSSQGTHTHAINSLTRQPGSSLECPIDLCFWVPDKREQTPDRYAFGPTKTLTRDLLATTAALISVRSQKKTSDCSPNKIPDTISVSSAAGLWPVSCNGSYITVSQWWCQWGKPSAEPGAKWHRRLDPPSAGHDKRGSRVSAHGGHTAALSADQHWTHTL